MNKQPLIIKIILAGIFLLVGFGWIDAQEPDPTYRRVTSKDEFIKKEKSVNYKPSIARRRPVRSKEKKKSSVSVSVKIKTGKKPSDQPSRSDWEELGFTLWKLRKKIAGESNPALKIWENGIFVDYVPERIQSNTELSKGDKIRITIESPREGYLYIFDREKFTNESYGKTYLIFPTRRTRNGNNRVEAGVLTDIPDQNDDMPIFIINSDDPNYNGEIISVIISDQPIDEITIPAKTTEFDSSAFNYYLKNWGLTAEVYEMDGGKGTAWTSAEKDAGDKNLSRSLTQADPPPQTVYRFQSKPNVPIMVNFVLTVKK